MSHMRFWTNSELLKGHGSFRVDAIIVTIERPRDNACRSRKAMMGATARARETAGLMRHQKYAAKTRPKYIAPAWDERARREQSRYTTALEQD